MDADSWAGEEMVCPQSFDAEAFAEQALLAWERLQPKPSVPRIALARGWCHENRLSCHSGTLLNAASFK
jgi:hypothetical protein